MKRMIGILCMAILLFVSACSVEPTPDAPVSAASTPTTEGMKFCHSSGMGAWCTTLDLRADGSFTGQFMDEDAGVRGDAYPNGTAYLCRFSGKFEDIKRADEHSYRMTLAEITTEHTDGKEWIEDGVRYIASGPAGLTGGDEFILYLPGTPTDSLPQEFLWWMLYFTDPMPETLPNYAILNVATNDGFFPEP